MERGIDLKGLSDADIELINELVEILRRRRGAKSEEERKRFLRAAGGWEKLIDDNFLQEIYEMRKLRRKEVEI